MNDLLPGFSPLTVSVNLCVTKKNRELIPVVISTEYLPIFERYGTYSFASSGGKLNKCSLFQSAFMTLLGDPNDLVQDAASKGIGIVYDNCSEADREKMVGSLLDTILGGRKEVNKVRAPS